MESKSKSETPRVDAAIKSIHEDHKLNHVDDFNHYFLMTGLLSDFARQLEKELNEAIADISAASKQIAELNETESSGRTRTQHPRQQGDEGGFDYPRTQVAQ